MAPSLVGLLALASGGCGILDSGDGTSDESGGGVVDAGTDPAEPADSPDAADPSIEEPLEENPDDLPDDEPPVDPVENIYVTRVQNALAAWEIELDDSTFGSTRTTDLSFVFEPRHWITSSEGCTGNGVPDIEGSLGNCPFDDDQTVGFCYIRVNPESGVIYDTTQVMRESFQDGDAPSDDKQQVFNHETGHCLGLKHTASTDNVMYQDTSGPSRPTAAELAAIAEVYGGASPAPPSASTGDAFYSSTGEFYRYHDELPVFHIDTEIGPGTASVAAFLVPPMPGPPIGEVVVYVHEMRADGECRHRVRVRERGVRSESESESEE